jgi:hypothetical protein
LKDKGKFENMRLFKQTRPHFNYLHKKWKKRHDEKTERLFDKHLKTVAMTSLGGLMLLTAPSISPGATLIQDQNTEQPMDQGNDTNKELANRLKNIVPSEDRKLTDDEDRQIEQVVNEVLEIPVAAEIDGKRLNRTYGVMGGEQHLYRYPGDNVYAHARTAHDWAMYGPSGIAPGLGAYGYFASSKLEMTPEIEDRERYYIAVQTFLSPGFAERVGEYRDFYRFRKMLVINPKTGQAVVTVIGDAGPGVSTKKHLGGSPEVMHFLGIAKGPRKGAVLYYFIEDPENQVPLGPVSPKGKV